MLGIVATDQRYRAAAALAPTVGARSLAAASNATRPVMLIAGKLDDYVRFDDTQRLYGAFPSTGPEHWLIALPRAGHFNVADRCPSPQRVGCGPNDLPLDRSHALVNRWATAFLLRHVGLDDRYESLLDPSAAVGEPDVEISVIRQP